MQYPFTTDRQSQVVSSGYRQGGMEAHILARRMANSDLRNSSQLEVAARYRSAILGPANYMPSAATDVFNTLKTEANLLNRRDQQYQREQVTVSS